MFDLCYFMIRMHSIYQYFHIFGINIWGYAVTKIKYMTSFSFKLVKHFINFSNNNLRRGIEDRRI